MHRGDDHSGSMRAGDVKQVRCTLPLQDNVQRYPPDRMLDAPTHLRPIEPQEGVREAARIEQVEEIEITPIDRHGLVYDRHGLLGHSQGLLWHSHNPVLSRNGYR